MANKTFVVTHAKARAALTVRGKTLEDALKKEGLNPTIWHEVALATESEEEPNGDNHEAAGADDN